MVPATECLDVGDLPGLDVADGLVHEAELSPGLERVRQEAAEHEQALHALVVLDRVHLHRAATLLGQVHGDVGPLQQQGRVVTVLGCHGDAGAGGDGQGEAVHLDGSLHFEVELVHNLNGALGILDVGDHQSELVTAQPGHRGAAGGDAEESFGHFAQQAVADGVTERVVHVLEAVDVQQHNGHPAAFAQGGSSAGQEEEPVGKTGEHVVGGLVRFGVDLVTQLLDQPGTLEAGAGVGDECLEESQVVLVEAVHLFVAIDRNDGADRGVLVHEGRHHGVVVVAGDGIDRFGTLPGRGVVERGPP